MGLVRLDPLIKREHKIIPEDFKRLVNAIKEPINPVVICSYPLEECVEAYRYLKRGIKEGCNDFDFVFTGVKYNPLQTKSLEFLNPIKPLQLYKNFLPKVLKRRI